MTMPKFKLSKQEMLAFNDDCDNAARHCPQFRGWGPEDRTILLGEISAKQLVKVWKNCDTLFKSGYEELLSDETMEIFNQYREYKAEKRVRSKK